MSLVLQDQTMTFYTWDSHTRSTFDRPVPTEHRTTVYSVDWAQPTEHGPTVHKNNRAPCRLGMPPVDTIVHQLTVYRVDCARPTGFNCTQVQLCTMLTEHSVHSRNWGQVICATNRSCMTDWARFGHTQNQVGTETIGHAVFWAIWHERIQHEVNSAPPIEHDSIAHECNWAPCRLSTSTIVHLIDWARVQLCILSTGHEYNCVPLKLCTTATILCLLYFAQCTVMYDWLGTIQSCTNTNGQRNDWTRRFLSKLARENSARS